MKKSFQGRFVNEAPWCQIFSNSDAEEKEA